MAVADVGVEPELVALRFAHGGHILEPFCRHFAVLAVCGLKAAEALVAAYHHAAAAGRVGDIGDAHGGEALRNALQLAGETRDFLVGRFAHVVGILAEPAELYGLCFHLSPFPVLAVDARALRRAT